MLWAKRATQLNAGMKFYPHCTAGEHGCRPDQNIQTNQSAEQGRTPRDLARATQNLRRALRAC